MGIDTPDGGRRAYSNEFAMVLGQDSVYSVLSNLEDVNSGASKQMNIEAPEEGKLYHIRSFRVVEPAGTAIKAFFYWGDMGIGFVRATGMYERFVPLGSPMFLVSPDYIGVNVFNTTAGAVRYYFYVEVDEYILPDGWIRKPIASCSADDETPAVSQVVHFTDESLNDPVEWHWEFDDGSTSELQNPSHAYTQAGSYIIRLFATNSGGTSLYLLLITVS